MLELMALLFLGMLTCPIGMYGPIGSLALDTPMNDDVDGFAWSLMSGTYRYQLPSAPCCAEGAHRCSGLSDDCTQPMLWYVLSLIRTVGADQLMPSVEK